MFRHAVSIAAYSRLGAPCDFCPIASISPSKSAIVKAGSIPPFGLTSCALASSLLKLAVKSFTDSIPALHMFKPPVQLIPHDQSSKFNAEGPLSERAVRHCQFFPLHLEALRAVDLKRALAGKIVQPYQGS